MKKGSISDRPPDIGGLTAGDRITAAVNACAAWAYHRVVRAETRLLPVLHDKERWIWRSHMVGMPIHGLNKRFASSLQRQNALALGRTTKVGTATTDSINGHWSSPQPSSEPGAWP